MSDTQRPSPCDASPPNPRHFAVRTGVVLMGLGLLLSTFLCVSWLTGQMPGRPSPGARWVFAIPYATILVTFLGGLGLFAAGVGLYGERPSAPTLAIAMTSLLVSWYAFAAVVFACVRWMSVATFCAVCAVLLVGPLLLSVRSLVVMRRFPPPDNVVTDDWIRQQAQQRRKAREESAS